MMRRRAIMGKGKPQAKSERFVMEISVTTNGESFTLPTRSGYTYDYTVFWGDGTSNSYNVATQPTHTYANAGTYEVEIEGRFDTLYFNNGGSKLMVRKVLSWGGGAQFDGFTSMEKSLFGCSNIISLAAGGVKERAGSPITSFFGAFYGCSGLTALPADLFRYNTSVMDLRYAFQSCSGLTALPADLFRYNTNAVYFDSAFHSCSGLTALPADLFRYNTNVTIFSSAFRDCSKLTLRSDIFGTDYATRFLNQSVYFSSFARISSFTGTQGVAPALWSFNFGTGTPTKTGAFSGHSLSSVSNYNDIPADWK